MYYLAKRTLILYGKAGDIFLAHIVFIYDNDFYSTPR